MVILTKANEPFHTLHLDVGELSKRSDGHGTTRSFLVMVDEFSRMTYARSMRETTGAVIQYLEQFPILDKVRKIVTDNGAQFTSMAMREFAE